MRANPEIDALLAELLDSGVSPKYVSRLARELEEHYADLEAEAARLGVPDGEVAEDARRRLGDCSAIAKEFERRPELQSWVYRSRCLERFLRALVHVYLIVRAPARIVASSQAAMLRYTAATTAGASVTCCILLLLTTVMPSDPSWGVRFVEHAGIALGGWEADRPATRQSPGTRRIDRPGNASPAPREAAPAPDDGSLEPELEGTESAASLMIRFERGVQPYRTMSS